MKNLLYIALIVPIFLVAGLNVNKVSEALADLKSVRPNRVLKFFNDNKSIKLTKKLKFTSLKNANIILFTKKKIKNKMLIVDSYRALQDNKNSIGAIYLKKGRTQIIFIEERLKKNDLLLPKSYNKYILSECQINPICLLTDIN